jgi:hypothetical protein
MIMQGIKFLVIVTLSYFGVAQAVPSPKKPYKEVTYPLVPVSSGRQQAINNIHKKLEEVFQGKKSISLPPEISKIIAQYAVMTENPTRLTVVLATGDQLVMTRDPHPQADARLAPYATLADLKQIIACCRPQMNPQEMRLACRGDSVGQYPVTCFCQKGQMHDGDDAMSLADCHVGDGGIIHVMEQWYCRHKKGERHAPVPYAVLPVDA